MRTLLSLALLAVCAAPALAQDPDSTNRGAGRVAGGRAGGAPRPYDRVITADAKTKRGLMNVHRIGDRLFFEIPRRELQKDQLLIGRFARAAPEEVDGVAVAPRSTPAINSPSAPCAGK